MEGNKIILTYNVNIEIAVVYTRIRMFTKGILEKAGKIV